MLSNQHILVGHAY